MSVKTTYKDLGESRVRAMIEEIKLGGLGVKVGLIAEDGGGDQANGAEPGVTVADVAAWNEFGTDTIPERAFMRNSARILEREMPSLQGTLLMKIVLGKLSVDAALDVIGLTAQAVIKDTIRTYPWVPNAPSTIRRKGSSQPLIDTAQMLNSIHYVKFRRVA